MTSAGAGLAEGRPGRWRWRGRTVRPLDLERLQLGLLAAIAATCLVSIFAAQLFLVLALAVYLARLLTRQARLERTPLDGPILAFAVWTFLSASFSPDPLTSHRSAKQLVLFSLLYLAVESFSRERDRERILDAVLLGGVALGAGSLLQYYFLGFDTLDNRPRSFLGHYMTASGLLMGVLVLAAARLAFLRPPWPRPASEDLRLLGSLGTGLVVLTFFKSADLFAVEVERLFVATLAAAAVAMAVSKGRWPGHNTGAVLAAVVIPLASWALLVSRTRNAWLGAIAGLALLAVLRAPRMLWLLPATVALVLILDPGTVADRLTLSDASSRDRYYMWQAGIDMILDKPVFGQGPGMVKAVYPEYRWPGAPNPRTAHLHDNALQIAAERGLPCLAWWLWWVAAAMGDAYRETRRDLMGSAWVAVAAMGFLAALMVAGLFEYNFGDSEILMLTLLISALPYGLRRQRQAAA